MSAKFVLTTIIIIIILLSFSLCNFYKKKERYIDPMITSLYNDMLRIDPRVKDVEMYSSDESYTEDKKRIYICLRDENNQYYPYNQLLDVAIHEISHALCPVIDEHHTTPEWNNLYRANIRKAIDLKIYDPEEPKIANYCKKQK